MVVGAGLPPPPNLHRRRDRGWGREKERGCKRSEAVRQGAGWDRGRDRVDCDGGRSWSRDPGRDRGVCWGRGCYLGVGEGVGEGVGWDRGGVGAARGAGVCRASCGEGAGCGAGAVKDDGFGKGVGWRVGWGRDRGGAGREVKR